MKINMGRIIIHALFDRTFRFWLKGTIIYALKHHCNLRGEGASDVLLFIGKYSDIIYPKR